MKTTKRLKRKIKDLEAELKRCLEVDQRNFEVFKQWQQQANHYYALACSMELILKNEFHLTHDSIQERINKLVESTPKTIQN